MMFSLMYWCQKKKSYSKTNYMYKTYAYFSIAE